MVNEYEYKYEYDNILDKIAHEKNCNNGKGKNKHGYTKWYHFHLKDFRHRKNNLLEIGVDQGNSLYMWQEYFKNSTIYGIDKNRKNIPDNVKKQFKVFIGDQKDKKFLNKVCRYVSSGFDVIIDDASHIPQYQVRTFVHLFRHLKSGGIYAIEDLYSSYYPKFEEHKYPSFIDFCKNMIDDINFHGRFKWCNFDIIKKNIFTDIRKKGKRHLEPRSLNEYEEMISSIHFYNGLCFVYKR